MDTTFTNAGRGIVPAPKLPSPWGEQAEPTNMKPIRNEEDQQGGRDSRDHAGNTPGWTLPRLERMVADCDDQPDWRPRADLAAAFVDGKQFTPEMEAMLRAEGLQDLRPVNLTGRTIRSVCGQEAKSRTDVKVESDDDETAEVSDVLNAAMKESQRETYADLAVSAAYFGQVGPGIGWVGVREADDPLDYPDVVEEIHRSEMWWDWKSKDLLLRDARWVARKRWSDLDELEARMPQHRWLLQRVANNWDGFMWDGTPDEARVAAWTNEARWSNYQRRTDWYDSARKRVKLYEIWYKTPAWVVVMHLGPNRRVLFDERNPAHVHAVASGRVPVTKELSRQVRMALFAGPHRLQDIGTTRRNFPYVPFFAYRDDEDLSPYGLVEGMIAPQMEFNARRARINWMLRARQILMDNDALDTEANTLKEIAKRVMRPDLTVVLNANRKHADAFRIQSNLQMQKEQFDVMQDAKQLMQDVPGVYGSQLGQAPAGVTSGIANSILVEQGNVSMGDLNDNYRHARRAVFELLLENIVARHNTAGLQVKVGRGSNRRVVILNMWEPQSGEMHNNVLDAPTRVGLGEVPSTPAFRMQQQNQIATIITAIAATSPNAAAILAPTFIESTDLPDRLELAEDLRRLTGVPTKGDKDRAAKVEAMAQQEQQRQQQLQDAAVQLELKDKAAKIDETVSKTKLNEAKVVELGHNMGMQHNQPEPEPTAGDGASRLIDQSIAEAQAAVAA